MPIIMTARYQVRPQSIDRCKQAIKNLVEYVKKTQMVDQLLMEKNALKRVVTV